MAALHPASISHLQQMEVARDASQRLLEKTAEAAAYMRGFGRGFVSCIAAGVFIFGPLWLLGFFQ